MKREKRRHVGVEFSIGRMNLLFIQQTEISPLSLAAGRGLTNVVDTGQEFSLISNVRGYSRGEKKALGRSIEYSARREPPA